MTMIRASNTVIKIRTFPTNNANVWQPNRFSHLMWYSSKCAGGEWCIHESKLVLDVVLGTGLTGALSMPTAADGGGIHCVTMSSLPINRKARCSWS